jgi:hypothetical protein
MERIARSAAAQLPATVFMMWPATALGVGSERWATSSSRVRSTW